MSRKINLVSGQPLGLAKYMYANCKKATTGNSNFIKRYWLALLDKMLFGLFESKANQCAQLGKHISQ